MLTAVGAFCMAVPDAAQVAGGTTTVEASITGSTRLAMGWSVKKTLMGKTVFNDAGQKMGKVEDLIVSPDRNVSYVIIGTGGFVGIGRHDVAIEVTQIQDKAGKLAEMKRATAVRWREFETDVSAATARMRKSMGKAMG